MLSVPYSTSIPAGGHWSLRLRRGTQLTLTDTEGGANVGLLMYNPEDLLERYNAPDTLKCQHTFKLTRGHCLYSDMGRIFASIVEDSLGWHETVCGNSTAAQVAEKWGKRDYQKDRNEMHQNGYDAFIVELAKYGLGPADMAANLNLFSKVAADDEGGLRYQPGHSPSGSTVTLRFEMDTLVLLHTCPHPLNDAERYPAKPVELSISVAPAVTEDDYCRNFRPENQRGFANNALYYLGSA
ncbi:urea amidolyase associated protein UAAP1 [Allohahella marinimesophila]|uniref:Urea carboxylase-associated family protein n=1 Tax=Allohahella marinimesophila TaxID=1054972 RepID=A0ABP7NG23_9GAMM